jgi:hypothetical protein
MADIDAKLNLPDTLYRYRALNTTTKLDREIAAIKTGQLYFSVFKALNDPMEGLSRKSLMFKKNDVDTKRFKKIVDRKEKIGICSLSDSFNNEVMWAHYAEDYSGICVGYRTRSLLKGLDDKCALVRIQYVDRSPQLTGADAKNVSLAARKILAFKKGRWEYEREWRLLSDKIGLIAIDDPRCVASIRMGSRIKRDHRIALEKLVKTMDGVRLYVMQVRSYEPKWDRV